MVVSAFGSTTTPFLYRVGIQYEAWSPVGAQLVAPAFSDSNVLAALVEVLPRKVWLCDAPGRFGNTIGSSLAWWLTKQDAWNSGTRTALAGGVRGVRAKNAATAAACAAWSTGTQPGPVPGGRPPV